MKLFKSTQEYFAILGIKFDQLMQINLLYKKILVAVTAYVSALVLYTAFLFHEVNNFSEYTTNIYTNSATLQILLNYVIVIFNVKNCSALIDNCMTIVFKSKYLQGVFTIVPFTWTFQWIPCFRSWKSRIKGNVWENQSEDGKIQQNHLFNYSKSDFCVDGVP